MIKRGSPLRTVENCVYPGGAVPLDLPGEKMARTIGAASQFMEVATMVLPSWQVFLGYSHPHDASATGSWWGPVPSQVRMKCAGTLGPHCARSTTALASASDNVLALVFFTNIHRKPYSPGILG